MRHAATIKGSLLGFCLAIRLFTALRPVIGTSQSAPGSNGASLIPASEITCEINGLLQSPKRLLVTRARPAPHWPHAVTDLADLPVGASKSTKSHITYPKFLSIPASGCLIERHNCNIGRARTQETMKKSLGPHPTLLNCNDRSMGSGHSDSVEKIAITIPMLILYSIGYEESVMKRYGLLLLIFQLFPCPGTIIPGDVRVFSIRTFTWNKEAIQWHLKIPCHMFAVSFREVEVDSPFQIRIKQPG